MKLVYDDKIANRINSNNWAIIMVLFPLKINPLDNSGCVQMSQTFQQYYF